MKVKEERQDLNEVEEKHQDQKDHVTGEKSVNCSIQITEVKKAFCCSQCGKSFTRKRHLKDHLVTPSSEKPFSCSQCGNTYNIKKALGIT